MPLQLPNKLLKNFVIPPEGKCGTCVLPLQTFLLYVCYDAVN